MRHYYAPLEGLTDSIYRRLHHEYFPGMDRYYTPFLSPTIHRCLTPKEQRELPPADSIGYCTIPQVLTKNADDFNWLASQCVDLGYQEVNLNLGCPSGTVTAKGKGSGMLAAPDALKSFLDSIFSSDSIHISVKTRLGVHSSDEFPKLLEIFNDYPIKELIIHPRVRDAFYKGNVDMQAFAYAAANSRNPLCFNGNLCSREDIDRIAAQFPQVESVMIGRGLICDPGMLTAEYASKETLQQFHSALLNSYIEAFGSSRNAMFRLKEHWFFLICKFQGGEKLLKQLRKTTSLEEYIHITEQIFQTLPFLPIPNISW